MRKKLITFLLLLLSSGLVLAQDHAMRVWHFDKSNGYWIEAVPLDSLNRGAAPSVGTAPAEAVQASRMSLSNSDNKRYKVSKTNNLSSKSGDTSPDASAFSLHSNALYDCLLAPNLGLEFAVGDDWSLGVDGWLAWLRNSEHDLWWQNYGFDLYARYWFGYGHNAYQRKGWHAGLYAGTFTYDVWTGGKGYQSPDLFKTFHAGLEVGWSMSIGKDWSLDLFGGTGLLHTFQKVYHHNFGGGYYVSESRHRNLLDFTRFGITFSYIIR